MFARKTPLLASMMLITIAIVTLAVCPVRSSFIPQRLSRAVPADYSASIPSEHSYYISHTNRVLDTPTAWPHTLHATEQTGQVPRIGWGRNPASVRALTQPTSTLEADIAVEADYQYYAYVFAGNIVSSTDYITQLINAVSAIFERDIHVRLYPTFVRIATTPHNPWQATDASAELVEVRNYWMANGKNFPRSVVLFLSGRNLGGGLAYRSGLCSQANGYAVVSSIKGYFTTQPSASTWDLVSVAHELGHIFGSRHSYCYKRADGTWYDECYSDPPSSECYSGPIHPSDGTIMSYCYLASSSMTSINPISFTDGDPAMTDVMRTTAENVLARKGGGCRRDTPKVMTRATYH